MSVYKNRSRDKGNINSDYIRATQTGVNAVNASKLSASNLIPNYPIKTDNLNVLQSTKLSISDTNGLQNALDNAGGIQYNGTIPAPIGNLVKINDVDGNVEDSTITEAIVNGKLDKAGDTMTGNLNLGSNDIDSVGNIDVTTLDGVQLISGTNTQDLLLNNAGFNIKIPSCNLDLNNNSIENVFRLNVGRIKNPALTNIDIENDLYLRDNNITKVANINVDTFSVNTLPAILFNDDVSLFNNNIVSAGDIKTTSFSSTDFKTNDIDVNANFDMNNNNIENVNTLEINSLGKNGTGDISIQSDIDVNNFDLKFVSNLDTNTLTIGVTTQYITNANQLPTPVGNYHIIPDNTTWIICGQITLTYGIEFGVNCSLRGVDFSAQIIFDETNNDCDIKAVDNNFYLSQLTIVNGGGRFTGNTTLVRGLLNATNYNVGAPAPFYGRNKRFKITDCNILRPFKIGTVEGFGTLNVTNNFFNGGGGLAGQATSYYTNEGMSVSDGLSLEFNNNKMVLMAGAQQASTLKLLNMKARVSSLLGINACTITGNIFHPRNSETGIDFHADSRTQLGNISGNVFIRTGGTFPLINYTDQPTYDNYNPLSIENYSINANTGVVNSEPNLKSGIGTSDSISSATATLIEPSDNSQVEIINLSSRFGIQLDLTGVTVAFVANERITDTVSGNTALILAVDAEAGGNQSVYITDMSAMFDATPTTFTSATGNATGGSLRYIYRYSEKDPRKLVLTSTFSVDVGSNKEYFIAPSMNGMADTICEVGGVSTNTGAGATLTVVCAKKYEEGDKEQFYFRTGDGSAGNIEKGIIVIK